MICGHLAILKSAYKMVRKKISQHDKDWCVIRDGESRRGVMKQLLQAGMPWKEVSSPSSPEGLQGCRGTWA